MFQKTLLGAFALVLGLSVPASADDADCKILRPKADRTVTPIDQVMIRTTGEADHRIPVIMIRSKRAGSPWVVQDSSRKLRSSLYRVPVRYPYQGTTVEQFEVVAVMVAPSEAASYTAGTQLNKLPENASAATTINVFCRPAIVADSIPFEDRIIRR